eukprot:3288211-Amphidinium_carterae.1
MRGKNTNNNNENNDKKKTNNNNNDDADDANSNGVGTSFASQECVKDCLSLLRYCKQLPSNFKVAPNGRQSATPQVIKNTN